MNASLRMKHEVIKQISERGRLIAEVAQDFGVSSRQVYRWLKDDQPSDLKDGQASENNARSERPLEEEVAMLRMQLFTVCQQLTALKSQINQ